MELSPGIQAVEIPSAFDIRRYTLHDAHAIVRDDPQLGLSVQSKKKQWSYVVSFPSRFEAFYASDGRATLGWLTQVEVECTSGGAELAYASEDCSQLFGEVPLSPGVRQADLLLENREAGVRVMARVGNATELNIRLASFRCFNLVEDDSTIMRGAGSAVIRPMARWSRFYGDPGGSLPERVRYMRFRRLTEPRLMEWVEELEVLVLPQEQISQAVYVSGLYEPCTAYALHRLLSPGDTFVDVGANVGLFAMLGSRWVGPSGRVLAFEPSRREFNRLQHHVNHNSLHNIQAFQMAIGHHNGIASLHVADVHHSGLNTLEDKFLYSGVTEVDTETVPVVRLDDFLAAQDVGRVDVMKIDVEGGEHHVVDGARHVITKDRPALILEIAGDALAAGHAGRSSIEQFLTWLEYGFIAVDGEQGLLRPTSGLATSAENVIAVPRKTLERILRWSWVGC